MVESADFGPKTCKKPSKIAKTEALAQKKHLKVQNYIENIENGAPEKVMSQKPATTATSHRPNTVSFGSETDMQAQLSKIAKTEQLLQNSKSLKKHSHLVTRAKLQLSQINEESQENNNFESQANIIHVSSSDILTPIEQGAAEQFEFKLKAKNEELEARNE